MIRQGRMLCLSLLGISLQGWSADLLDFYHESMASDPRLQRAESEAAIYQARERYSFGALLPQAQISAQGTRSRRDSTGTITNPTDRSYYNGERYYFSVSQPLYNKTSWESFRSASTESEQYSARLDETRSLVAVDLLDRYTMVLAAEDNYQFVISERKAAEQQLSLVKARYDRQLAKLTDLLAVEARRDTLLAQELNAKNEVLLAREAMSEVLGRAVDEPFAPLRQGLDPFIELGTLEDWIQKGMAANSGLKASRLAVNTARSQVKAAAGNRHPSLTLNLSAQSSDIGYENAQVPTSETYVAAVNLVVPIYSGGQVSAQVAEAQARLRMAENQNDQVERTLRKDIRQAFLNARSATERVAATKKALVSAEKSYQAQTKGLEYGTVTVVDVLNASETLFEAKRDHRRAYYDLMLEALTLYQIAGEFSAEKMADFNSWLETAKHTDS